jgi:hypothetical protein
MAYGWIGTGCEIAEVRPEAAERILRDSHAAYYAGSVGDSRSRRLEDELAWLSPAFDQCRDLVTGAWCWSTNCQERGGRREMWSS